MSHFEPRKVHATIHGQTLVLAEDIGLPDGTPVLVAIEPVPPTVIEAEDRAILEHVYQERGCGVERDC